jgi:hypothetical protein
MAQLLIAFSDLYTRISNFLGYTDRGTAPTGTDLTTCKEIAERGYRQFLYPVDQRTGQLHNWSFLKKYYTMPVTSGKWKYELPKDFSEFLSDPYYDDQDGYRGLRKVTPEYILELRAGTVISSAPASYAIVPFTYDKQVGTYYEIWFDYVPDSSYTLKFFYRIDPIKPDTATDYLVGGVRATEAILESCLAVAESQEDEVIGIHNQLAMKLIQELIQSDVQQDSDYLGNLYSQKMNNGPDIFRTTSLVDTDDLYA